ncbi:UNVERIFIED_CONTAM: hypothetical protein RKD50_000449 [Streptomyces canus]
MQPNEITEVLNRPTSQELLPRGTGHVYGEERAQTSNGQHLWARCRAGSVSGQEPGDVGRLAGRFPRDCQDMRASPR